jgi:post-segregation antitoxin (ccd killing protein)
MRIKIRRKLDAILVAEARALGLDISQIVEGALIRETAAERIRRQAGQAVNREGGDDPV